MVNLTKGQIKMVNLIEPNLFNVANLIKPWLFLCLTKFSTWHLVKKVTLIKCTGQM